MTQDETIELARQAGLHVATDVNWMPVIGFGYAKKLIELAAEKEREACAEMCKKHADVYGAFESTPSFQAAWAACIDLRDQIRARGEA